MIVRFVCHFYEALVSLADGAVISHPRCGIVIEISNYQSLKAGAAKVRFVARDGAEQSCIDCTDWRLRARARRFPHKITIAHRRSKFK